ncbi:MAG: 3-hydroxyacyl-CoA dehydrogenase family protein [Bacteroidota bacterium]
MKILVLGEEEYMQEFDAKFGRENECTYANHDSDFDFQDFDVVFDLSIDESPENIERYAGDESLTVFCNTAKISLAEIGFLTDEIACELFGFNGLPTFIDREVMEVSLYRDESSDRLKEICEVLGTDHLIVDDRVGMVTPRVLCMIINEAFYTVQEGTSTKEEIDLGMKLGTNYPHGPFEWCEKIGVKHVYEILEAIYEDTKDERYKICSLLKKEYLKTA